MAFTRNVNKPLSLSFGSYPISIEWLGRMLDADWIWAGADGARNGSRRPTCVRRHDSPQHFAQNRAASDHMLKAHRPTLNYLGSRKAPQNYWGPHRPTESHQVHEHPRRFTEGPTDRLRSIHVHGRSSPKMRTHRGGPTDRLKAPETDKEVSSHW